MPNNVLPLERWRQVNQYHPLHFWGLIHSTLAPIESDCTGVLPKYAWQDANATSRNQIEQEIDDAEVQLKPWLGYYPAPRYVEETVRIPTFYRPDLWRYGSSLGSDGHWLSVNLPDKHVLAVGVEAFTHLGTLSTLTASDEDGDGLEETWEASIEITDTNITADEIIIRVPDSYLPDQCQSIQIAPVDVCLEAGGVGCGGCNVATIRGKKWQLVKPLMYEGFDWSVNGLNAATTANFMTSLEVYRRYTSAGGTQNENAQAKLIWETLPCPEYVCTDTATDNSSDPATVGETIARAGIRDSRLGIVYPAQAVYNSTLATWSSGSCLTTGRLPDRVTVRYLAGHPYKYDSRHNAYIDPLMERMIVALSTANLDRPLISECSGYAGNAAWNEWRVDVTEVGGDRSYNVTARDLDNPFGRRWGHVWAWRQIRAMAVHGAVSA